MNVLSSNGLDIQLLEASTWFQPKYEDLGKLHKEKVRHINNEFFSSN